VHAPRLTALAALALSACAATSERAPSPGCPESPRAAPPPEAAAPAPQEVDEGAIPVPVFVDPARRAKLATAFPEIERIFTAYKDKEKIPGLAFGVIAKSLASLVERWDEPSFTRLAGPKLDRAKVKRAFADATVNHAACTVESVTAGDGHTKATVALRCAREPAKLSFEVDEKTNKLTAVELLPADWPAGRCAR
jgi:hypothetical protein